MELSAIGGGRSGVQVRKVIIDHGRGSRKRSTRSHEREPFAVTEAAAAAATAIVVM